MEFSKRICCTEEIYRFSESESSLYEKGDMLLFSFELKGDEASRVYITIDAGVDISNKKGYEKTVGYTITSQLSKIYMPVINNGLKSVGIKAEGDIEIYKSVIENLGRVSHSQIQQKSGLWLCEDFEYCPVDSRDGMGAGSTIDLAVKNGYIYSIGGGRLTITKEDTLKPVSALTFTGTLRQIALTDDGRYILVTCRQEGMLVINAENPLSPYIVACYDTVELATGLFVSGKYAFVCNRQYGVEIVDISDPCVPRHLANIRSGEVQSCIVRNNILYAGVWGECGVYMYDLEALCDSPEIKPIGCVATNGKGDGLSVADIDGETYLFAATGHCRTDCAHLESPLSNLCHGQGNGFDIYNVTNPSEPYWVSGGLADGRFYHTANDYWKTEVSFDKKNGRYYMYLVNTYNGVFVYDVTDIKRPIRLMHIPLVMPVSEKYPVLTHNIRHIVTPWNQQNERRSPVGAAVPGDGVIYIGGADSDLYCVKCEYAFRTDCSSAEVKLDRVDSGFYDIRNLFDKGADAGALRFFESDGKRQIYAFAVKEDVVYTAQGDGGVGIYEKGTMMQYAHMPARNMGEKVSRVYDVAVCGDVLFVAAGINGLRIYDISELSQCCPTHLHTCEENCATGIRQVVVAPGGRFVVIQKGTDSILVIDTMNGSYKVVYTGGVDGAMLYHRQISAPVFDRYICYWSHNGIEHWLDFGDESDRFDAPVEVCSPFRDAYGGVGMFHGLCGFESDDGNYIIKTTYDNKFLISDDIVNESSVINGGAYGNGMITGWGDCIVVTNRVTGAVDIYRFCGKDEGFAHLFHMICAGNPDRAFANGDSLYIPLGYQGFVILDRQIIESIG